MTKIDMTDPFAAVREAILSAVQQAKTQQDKMVADLQAEGKKLQDNVMKNFDKAIKAHHANVDSSVVAAKTAADGLAKYSELTQKHLKAIAEDRIAVVEKILAAGADPKAAQLPVELLKAEQEKHAAFVKEAEKLLKALADDISKPVQKQIKSALDEAAKITGA